MSTRRRLPKDDRVCLHIGKNAMAQLDIRQVQELSRGRQLNADNSMHCIQCIQFNVDNQRRSSNNNFEVKSIFLHKLFL